MHSKHGTKALAIPSTGLIGKESFPEESAHKRFACSTVGGVNIHSRKTPLNKVNLMVTRDLKT